MVTSKVNSLEDVRRAFSTQRKCEEQLMRLRWPTGVSCPKCGDRPVHWMQRTRRWMCRGCRHQFSVTSGTIFSRTKIPLPKWFQAIWLLCRSPKSISAKQVEREIGVHYETAWYMASRIRKAMRHDIFEDRLCGVVEVDDAEVKAGGPGGRGRIRAKVVGMAERDGALRMSVVDDLKKESIRRVIAKNLGDVKRIYSDAAQRYRYLREIAEHRYVTHHISYSDGEAHVNFVENAWSLFKRGLVEMFHHVSAKYLQDFHDEFAFRYSHRKEKHKMFDLVLANCEVGE